MKSLSMRGLQLVALGFALLQMVSAPAAEITSPPLQTPGGALTTPNNLEDQRKQALEEAESGKTEDAIRDFQQALALGPDWKEGWWNLGTLQYGANHFADAEGTFNKVVEFAPNLGIAWALLGLSEFEIKGYDAALLHLEKAQSLGMKDDAEIERVSVYHLGLLLIRAGDFERASDLLLATFGSGAMSAQVKIALGLATLRVPLLPDQVDPSQEALLLAAGGATAAGAEAPNLFAGLLKIYPTVPYLHYSYGLELEKTGSDQQALEQMHEETRLSPESPLPWIASSRIELHLGDAKQAISAAQTAVKHDAENKAAHEMLANAWDATSKPEQAASERALATQLAAGRQIPERRIAARYANTSSPGQTASQSGANQEIWLRAMQEYAGGQYLAAAADLKHWLQANPDSGTGWAVLGLCEFALKDYANAMIHLDRGAKLGLSGSPQSVQQARYTFGILLVHGGEFERASEVLMPAVGTGPLDAKVEVALGLALLRRAEFPDDVSPQDAGLIVPAGRIAVLLHQSHYDEAFAQFKPLLVKYPSTPFLHYAYGTALLALSEFDEARAQMLAEVAISPRSELPCLRLASIALRQHNSADAITWSKRALELAQDSPEAHYLLGRASLEAGDEKTAMRELEIASKLSPGSPEVHFNLAKAYARANMPEKAQQERATFSQLNEIAESQRSHDGSQIYAGPRETGEVTTTSPAAQTPAPTQSQ
jgi:tetratricopeptide (TPR) repeat protein